jgi:hypothetical protein
LLAFVALAFARKGYRHSRGRGRQRLLREVTHLTQRWRPEIRRAGLANAESANPCASSSYDDTKNIISPHVSLSFQPIFVIFNSPQMRAEFASFSNAPAMQNPRESRRGARTKSMPKNPNPISCSLLP